MHENKSRRDIVNNIINECILRVDKVGLASNWRTLPAWLEGNVDKEAILFINGTENTIVKFLAAMNKWEKGIIRCQ